MLTDDQTEIIRQRFSAEGKISAIKLYREFTQCSLRDAKNNVEQLISGSQPAAANQLSMDGGIDDSLMDLILDEIQSGNKIGAVKHYKDATGASLMDSKNFIEQLMDELEVSFPDSVGKTGCMFAVLVLISVMSLIYSELI